MVAVGVVFEVTLVPVDVLDDEGPFACFSEDTEWG